MSDDAGYLTVFTKASLFSYVRLLKTKHSPGGPDRTNRDFLGNHEFDTLVTHSGRRKRLFHQ